MYVFCSYEMPLVRQNIANFYVHYDNVIVYRTFYTYDLQINLVAIELGVFFKSFFVIQLSKYSNKILELN